MQNAGARQTIHFAIADSPLDRMLVARSAAGLCAAAFGDRDADLLAELHGRFPGAVLRRADDEMRAEATYLLEQLQPVWPASPQRAELAIDVAGTAFQKTVWAAAQQIPRGGTMEYGELAVRLGMPMAQRAVGAAIGSNPLAVLIPCHRLVARGGGLHRFRWGLERKQRLLNIERLQMGLEPVSAAQTQGAFRFSEPEPD